MPTLTTYAHGQFNWVDLMSPNTSASKNFYAGLFGWSHVDMPTDMGSPYTIFKSGDDELCGMGAQPPEMQAQGVPPTWNSYINVENLEEALQRVDSLGGNVFMPSMQVMEAGWMAGIMDPSGGRVFLWQKNRHIGATRVNDPGCFCWNELATREIESARGFYAELFGWEFEINPSAPTKYYIIHNQGEMNGGLMEMDSEWPDHVPANWGVYFTVENVDDACKQLQPLGGEVYVPIFEIPIGRIAGIRDPQNAMFYLFEFANGG